MIFKMQNQDPHYEHLNLENRDYMMRSFALYQEICSERLALHCHQEIEVVRFLDGTFDVAANMAEYHYNNHGIIFFPSNVMHTMFLHQGAKDEVLVFDPTIIEFKSQDRALECILQSLTQNKSQQLPVIDVNNPHFKQADKLLSEIIQNANTTDETQRLLTKVKLLEFLVYCYEIGIFEVDSITISKVKDNKQLKFKQLLDFINLNYQKPLNISDVAKFLGVTEQYFCRYFKQVSSMSFTEYMNDLRLRKAADAILNSHKAIIEIAKMYGFENQGYFIRMFKRKYRITPLQYRKQKQKIKTA